MVDVPVLNDYKSIHEWYHRWKGEGDHRFFTFDDEDWHNFSDFPKFVFVGKSSQDDLEIGVGWIARGSGGVVPSTWWFSKDYTPHHKAVAGLIKMLMTEDRDDDYDPPMILLSDFYFDFLTHEYYLADIIHGLHIDQMSPYRELVDYMTSTEELMWYYSPILDIINGPDVEVDWE